MMSYEAAKDLVIDESNFGEYFFDVRLHGPKPGQVMASYTSVVEFYDGPEKRQIMEFLKHAGKANSAIQVMKKALMAKDPDCYRVLREMGEDILSGMSADEVAGKPYKFIMEMCFWTNPEYIPDNDPHWACVSILNMNEHFAKKEVLETGLDIQVKSRIVQGSQDGESETPSDVCETDN